jgi:hypothetical protein
MAGKQIAESIIRYRIAFVCYNADLEFCRLALGAA